MGAFSQYLISSCIGLWPDQTISLYFADIALLCNDLEIKIISIHVYSFMWCWKKERFFFFFLDLNISRNHEVPDYLLIILVLCLIFYPLLYFCQTLLLGLSPNTTYLSLFLSTFLKFRELFKGRHPVLLMCVDVP